MSDRLQIRRSRLDIFKISIIGFLSVLILASIGCDKDAGSSSSAYRTTPNRKIPSDTDNYSISDIMVKIENLYSNSTVPLISVVGLKRGAKLFLYEGSCEGNYQSVITQDGYFFNLTIPDTYSENKFFVKLVFNELTECKPVDGSYIHLQPATVRVVDDFIQRDGRYPAFRVSGLYPGKQVKLAIYEDDTCSSSRVSDEIDTSEEEVTLTGYNMVDTLDDNKYYIKQSYKGISSCTNELSYKYRLSVDSLQLVYDDIMFGSSPTGVRVSRILDEGVVSLHKDSCENGAEDGVLYPQVEEDYSYHDLYLKYRFGSVQHCKKLDSIYLNLKKPILALDEGETALDRRSPVFSVTDLYPDKQVEISLFNQAECQGEPVSDAVNVSTGSYSLGPSSMLTGTQVFNWSLRQTYMGVSTCSEAVTYGYELLVSNLSVSVDSILSGDNPSSISVSKILPGASVALLRGGCSAEVDVSISEDGSITPTVRGEYEDNELYLKYSFNTEFDCQPIGSRYIYLQKPVISVNTLETNVHPSHPVFDIVNLFTEKNVVISIHEDLECKTQAVSPTIVTNTGSYSMNLIQDLFTDEKHSYYVKQSYRGVVVCSEGLVYKYDYDYSCAQKIPLVGSSLSYRCTGFEYNKSRLYGSNQNKAIVLSGTSLFHSIKVYKGTSCANETMLVGQGTLSYQTSLIETPILDEGGTYLSFLESDESGNELGCYTSRDPVIFKLPRMYASSGSSVLLGVDSTRKKVSFYNLSTPVNDIILDHKVVGVYTNYATTEMGSWVLLLDNGSIITAGNGYGVDISAVSEELSGSIPEKKVVSVYSNGKAFAALRVDGSVVTWGDNNSGGDWESVSAQLNETNPVVSVVSTFNAFSALRLDGSVVSWGSIKNGGSQGSMSVHLDNSSDVKLLYSSFPYGRPINDSDYAGEFFALRSDKHVVEWGGSNGSEVENYYDSVSVEAIYTNSKRSWNNYILEHVFLYSDGSISVPIDNNNLVVSIYSVSANPVIRNAITGVEELDPLGASAYVALRSDGSLSAWGESAYGGDISSVSYYFPPTSSIKVKEIFSTDYAFSALRTNGSVVSWGNSVYGADCGSVCQKLSGPPQPAVLKLEANSRAFVALREDGSVVSWGDPNYGGSSYFVDDLLDGSVKVKRIYSNGNSFVALREDGSVVSWGGQKSPGIIEGLDGSAPVEEVYYSNMGGFYAAIRKDGVIKTWTNRP